MKSTPAKPAKPKKNDAMAHVAARLDAEVIARLDALAAALAPLGSKPSRSIAARAAILTGLPILEAQYMKARKP